MEQCTGILEAHGRRWRCTRRSAKKYGGKLCGFCASLHPQKCHHVPDRGFGAKDCHSALCLTQRKACDLAAAPGG